MEPDPPRDVARLDYRRPERTGEPEVVYGERKTPEQVATLLEALHRRGAVPVMATRCSPEHAAALPEAHYDPVSRLLVARAAELDRQAGTVVVACAGTSDLPVAAEATGTLEAFGLPSTLVADVGVAGIHRILAESERLASADAVIVVAGMEGALPAVVAGLVPCPVIAVPTSVGYGASFDGLAALLGMLASCAPGIGVVNIDNGFGAAMLARRILLGGSRPGQSDSSSPKGGSRPGQSDSSSPKGGSRPG